MTTVAKLFGLITALLTTACASMPPVRMEATTADYEMLAGEWRGDYTSPALGRRGSIEFKLVAGENKAFGDVVMVPQGSGRPYEPQTTLEHPYQDQRTATSQVLTIFFVRASGGVITGTLDPYWDPDRNCNASTFFRGQLFDRTITGTFNTTWDCGAGQATGEWKVTRKAPKQSARR
jgi:hypothetical protein